MQSPLSHLAISPSGFVFDPQTGATFSVNATGRKLLEGIRDGMGLTALAEMLSRETEVGDADLRRDILEYTRTLQEQRLLAGDFELEL